MNENVLFSLQGYFRTGKLLPDGSIGALRWVGNVPEATLQLAVETASKNESFSGQRQQIGELDTSTTGTLNMTLDYWSSANLAEAFRATIQDITAGSVTGETFPTGLVAGDLVRLDHPFASSLVLTDSATTPVTVDTDDYALDGHSGGVVRIIDPTGYTQPFEAAYSYAAAKNVVLFSKPSEHVFLQFDGINTETGEPVLIDLWKIKFRPVQSLGLINAEYGNLPLVAAVLFDPTRALDPALGGFGRMLQKAA